MRKLYDQMLENNNNNKEMSEFYNSMRGLAQNERRSGAEFSE